MLNPKAVIRRVSALGSPCEGQDSPQRGEMSPKVTERGEVLLSAAKLRGSRSLPPSFAYGKSHLPRHTRPQAGVRERNRTKCGS